MNKKSVQGFTLIEVVLAIAVGLIIIAGVSVGYTYAKRAAIIDNQRKDVASIKTFVEQAIAATQANLATGSSSLVPPTITNNQLAALAERLPSLKFDPYTGAQRQTTLGAPTGCPTSVFSCYSGGGGQAGFSMGPVYPTGSGWGSGSLVAYFGGATFKSQFTITLADGSVRTFFGYVVLETDEIGNIVAADGGDTTTQQIGP